MARKPRVEFRGAFYHVFVRGNQRQKVFGDDRDRLAYLKWLEQYRERFGFSDYAEQIYKATDQRFLGDQAFVERVAVRTTDKDIEPTVPRASFERLLEAVTNGNE